MSEQFLYFLQQMFNGVTLGSTYALIAIGYTMVYGIIGMINFAHGEVYMIGSYVSFMIIAALMMLGIDTGWLLVVAGFVGAIVIASAYGWSIERVAYRPVRNSKRLIALISAIGMSIFLQNYVSLTEGSRDVALPSLFNGQWVVGHSENFSASITTMQAVIWIVTFLAMLALTIFIRYSRMGRACRACAEDLKMASLLGINTDRVIALTFVIGAAMAAVAGTPPKKGSSILPTPWAMSSRSAWKVSPFIREAEAPHSRLSIMARAAMVTMGEMRSESISRLRLPRCRRSERRSVRGMSPTTASSSRPSTAARAVAAIMPISEPGTFAPHFFGQTSMTATTSAPMRTAWRFGWKPRRA